MSGTLCLRNTDNLKEIRDFLLNQGFSVSQESSDGGRTLDAVILSDLCSLWPNRVDDFLRITDLSEFLTFIEDYYRIG